MENIIEKLRNELKVKADEKIRSGQEYFFRESVRFYGLKNAAVHEIARDYFKKLSVSSKDAVFDLCEQLWQSGYMEEAFVACDWSYRVRKEYVRDDFRVFGRWVDKYVTNWAACDTLGDEGRSNEEMIILQ